MVQIPTKILRATVYSPDGSQFTINPDEINTQFLMSLSVSMTITPQRNIATLIVQNLGERERSKISNATDATHDYRQPVFGGLIQPTQVQFPQGFAQQTANEMGKAYIVIEAGEDDSVGKVFEGAFSFPQSMWQPADWTTGMQISDGQATSAGSVIIIAFPKGATLFQIVSYVISRMGMTPGNFTEAQLRVAVTANAKSVFPKGFQVTAGGDWFLNEMFRLLGADWWQDRGKFYVVKKGQPIAGPEFEITDRTGGVRSKPQLFDKNAVRVDLDYRSALRVGTPVRIATDEVSGKYRCESVVHMLDNGEGDWGTQAIMRLIPNGT